LRVTETALGQQGGTAPIKTLDLRVVPVMKGVMQSLWASVQGDPVFMRRVNGWLTIFWIVMIPTSIATGWVKSVSYVSALSLWALVSGHWSAWQAARVEVNQQAEEARRARQDVAGEIVERIVAETEVGQHAPSERGREQADPRQAQL
jgi:hypothetical protein